MLQRSKNPERNKSKISWNFKKANWEKCTKVLENNVQPGKTDFNQSTADIGKTICNIINKYAKAYIPRGSVKGYKFFWNKDLEAIRNKRIYLRNRAELSGATEDIQAWRQPAAVFRIKIIESKRKLLLMSYPTSIIKKIA